MIWCKHSIEIEFKNYQTNANNTISDSYYEYKLINDINTHLIGRIYDKTHFCSNRASSDGELGCSKDEIDAAGIGDTVDNHSNVTDDAVDT